MTHVDDAPFFNRLPGNHHRRASAISSVLLVLILAACRSSLPAKFVEQAEPGVTLTTLTASPQEYRDKVVILGGVLVKEKENGGQVWLRLKNRPLDPQYHPHRPTSLDGPEAGHFWVTTSNPQQLPPQYRHWARMTLVPSAAVQRGAKGTFVYVVKEDKTVAVRPVTVGVSHGEDASISSGLAPNELVVVDGTEKLREGSKVEVRNRNEKPAQADAPAAPSVPRGNGP